MLINALILLSMMPAVAPPPLTGPEIVETMVARDNERLASLSGYTGTRTYHFENKRFNKRAEMTVRVVCDSTGGKTFEVTAEKGSGFVRNKVIRKMLDAEREASRRGEKQQTRIIPANYDFRLISYDVLDGRAVYVLEITPKTKNKFMICGRIWIDAEDFAIARIEGRPAKNPSFWITGVNVVHRYERMGEFWLPVKNESHAKARFFGATDVTIEYFDYVTHVRDAQAAGPAANKESNQ